MDAYNDRIISLTELTARDEEKGMWNPGELGLKLAIGFKNLNVTEEYGRWQAGSVTRDK
jgi:hypothetical protein